MEVLNRRPRVPRRAQPCSQTRLKGDLELADGALKLWHCPHCSDDPIFSVLCIGVHRRDEKGRLAQVR